VVLPVSCRGYVAGLVSRPTPPRPYHILRFGSKEKKTSWPSHCPERLANLADGATRNRTGEPFDGCEGCQWIDQVGEEFPAGWANGEARERSKLRRRNKITASCLPAKHLIAEICRSRPRHSGCQRPSFRQYNPAAQQLAGFSPLVPPALLLRLGKTQHACSRVERKGLIGGIARIPPSAARPDRGVLSGSTGTTGTTGTTRPACRFDRGRPLASPYPGCDRHDPTSVTRHAEF
jgi:hypothetical protein